MNMTSSAVEDSDYTSISSDIVFLSGSTDGTSQCVHITIIDDIALEGNQTFTVTLMTSDPDVRLGNDVTVITIEDNDCTYVSLKIKSLMEL